MKYTKLGNSDLTVSRICMGCMGFGDAGAGMHSWTLPEEQSREILKYGLNRGINFYDTAMGYQSGTSEVFVGRAMKDFARREEVVLATKFIPRTPAEIEQKISGQQHVRDMIDGSLKRMGLDYIDLYIYHMWDYHTPVEEIFFDDSSRLEMMERVYKGRMLPLLIIFSAVLLPQFITNMLSGRYAVAVGLGVALLLYVVIFVNYVVQYYRQKNNR